jgi:tRNA A37 threonylcarbamoyladenosine dehydratase
LAVQRPISTDRFEGVARLYSPDSLSRLQAAHVCVVGLGGVGSWSVEALARAGVGQLTLFDLDEICVSNINRQSHALTSTIGHPKVSALAERIRAINPGATVFPRQVFFTENNADELLAPRFDYVIDAIDRTQKKCLLIARCRKLGMPVVTVGAAGGRKDSTAIRVTDLGRSTHDRLLDGVRRRLRRDFGFPKGEADFGVACVHSVEPVMDRGTDEAPCPVPAHTTGVGPRLDCDGGYGSACHVTGAFGFAAAGHVIRQLSLGPRPQPLAPGSNPVDQASPSGREAPEI